MLQKKLIVIFAGVLSAAVALVLVVLLANSWDEDLKPEVQAAIQLKPEVTEQGQRAFYYMIGLRSGDTENIEAKGKEIWTKHLAENSGRGIMESFKKRDPWPDFDLPLTSQMKPLTPEFLKENPKWLEAFKKNWDSYWTYLDLISYQEMALIRDHNPMSHPSWTTKLLTAGRWSQVYLASLVAEKKWKDVEAHIQNENNFHTSIMRQGYLLEYMVAQVVIAANARFLEENLKNNPHVRISQKTIDSFKLPELDSGFRSSVAAEVQGTAEYISSEDFTRSFFSDDSWIRRSGLIKPMNYVFKPNETLNRFYDLSFASIDKDCIGSVEEQNSKNECGPAMDWLKPIWPWQWLRNPTGKLVTAAMIGSISGRKKKAAQYHEEISKIAGDLIGRADKKL